MCLDVLLLGDGSKKCTLKVLARKFFLLNDLRRFFEEVKKFLFHERK